MNYDKESQWFFGPMKLTCGSVDHDRATEYVPKNSFTSNDNKVACSSKKQPTMTFMSATESNLVTKTIYFRGTEAVKCSAICTVHENTYQAYIDKLCPY